MADTHSKEVRSYNMSQIKSKNTKPEVLVRKFLFSKGFRYRLYRKDLPGKPDIFIPKLKCIIDIRGCFWHGHNDCRYYRPPKTNTEWWLKKIGNNIKRDVENEKINIANGYNVVVIWECEIKKGDWQENLISKLKSLL
ncbi:very short patch repair endonuclease [Flavobacterium sp. H122]|uniref:very short patch repair endonuclease n=1 Tax=Flavobacterium sp. H122 TaxID=2529860 RepID=UPI0010AAA251|nr:very short patch repair endonuclease [Flavobacterium sp. H122]